MDDADDIKKVPIKNLHMEEGAEELMDSELMEPYDFSEHQACVLERLGSRFPVLAVNC